MNRKKVMVTMLAALVATSAWSDVSVMAEGISYVEKGSAVGDVAVAVGTASEAKGGGTIAIGRAHATSGNATAIGTDATASGSNSVALGANSKATESYTVSVGSDTMKRRIVNVDAGRNDNDVVIMRQVFGKATADGKNTNFGNSSVAWGRNSTVLAGKYFSGAIFGGTVLDNDSLAMGVSQ